MISGENQHFTLVRCESDEDWLAERRKGIGGSDVAAIMGLSAYSTPYQVWLEKTQGIHEDISEKPAVMWGNILEPVVGEHYMDCHPDRHVRRVNAIARSIGRPWAQASLDYEVRDPELGWGVLEIKTAGWRREQDWEDGTWVGGYLPIAVNVSGATARERETPVCSAMMPEDSAKVRSRGPQSLSQPSTGRMNATENTRSVRA